MSIPSVKSGRYLDPRGVTVSLFNLDIDDVDLDKFKPKAWGITAIECQVFCSPCHHAGLENFTDWEDRQEELIYPRLKRIRGMDLDLVALGDEICRLPQNREWLANESWARAAVQALAQRLTNYRCVGLELVDEANFLLGSWEPTDLCQWWNEIGGPPISIPGHFPGGSTLERFGTYISRYFPWWYGQRMPSYDDLLREYLRKTPRDKALSVLINCAGPWTVGGEVRTVPPTSKEILAQGWIALARGASRLRLWSYDPDRWRRDTGYSHLVGSKPGDDRWTGVAGLLASIRDYKEELYQDHYIPTYEGPWLYGRRGQFKWRVNTKDARVQSL